MKYGKKYFLSHVKHRLAKNQSNKWTEWHKVYAVNFFGHIFYYQASTGFKRNEFLNCIGADLRCYSDCGDLAEYLYYYADLVDDAEVGKIRESIKNYNIIKDEYTYLKKKLRPSAMSALMNIDFEDED